MRPSRVLVGVLGALFAVVGPANAAVAAAGRPAATPTGVHAAGGWCGGTEETPLDRPDVVGGDQVHVVYARAAGVPDRFAELAPKIVRDITGIDVWWRREDPTRTPRFDLAPFLYCDSKYGALDISSVQLATDNATYRSLGEQDFVDRVGFDLTTAVKDPSAKAPPAAFEKKYLVYLDVADSFENECGITKGDREESGPGYPSIVELQPPESSSFGSCDVGRLGSGTGYPAATAAHELVHNFDMSVPLRPHACFLDDAHVCDSDVDLMFGGNPPVSSITELHLDAAHDDYYGTPGPQYDVRNAAWLAHLDAAPRTLAVAVAPRKAGTVHIVSETFSCTERCSQPWDDGSEFSVWQEAAPGYAFDGWTGSCRAAGLLCSGTIAAGTSVTAHFARLVTVPVTVKGKGRVEQVDSDGITQDECTRRCRWHLPDHHRVLLVAYPGRHVHFAGWDGKGCKGSTRRCAFDATKRIHPVAVFEAD